MGYAHYWRRSPDLTPAHFAKAMEDIQAILAAVAERHVQIAGPTGYGKPELSETIIAFNGARDCGHRYRDLGSPWPSPTSAGVEATTKPVVGPWFSGALLETRVCGGNCSAAPFFVDRKFQTREWDQLEHGRYFQHCITDFKPYDLAVTASLIRLKERLGDDFVVTSDGREKGFEDAKLLCRELFGWNQRFALEPEESEVV